MMIDKDIELLYSYDSGFYWVSGAELVSQNYVEKHYKLALARIAELEAMLDRYTTDMDAHHDEELARVKKWTRIMRQSSLTREDGKMKHLQQYEWYESHINWLNGKVGQRAYLRYANLRYANLSYANLRGANLRDANLRGCKNLLCPFAWLEKNFKYDGRRRGYIVYKRIGAGKTHINPPESWVIEENRVIREVVNPLPTTDCGCGVNFGTREWCENEYKQADLWECLLNREGLASLVVPYNTDGKARTGALKLLKKVK